MPFRVVPHPVTFAPMGRLQVVQVQPSVANFEVIDYLARRDLFRSVFDWLGGAQPVAAVEGGLPAQPTPQLPRPEPPRVVAFPELYVPIEEFFTLAGNITQGQQVVTGGVIPEPDHAQGSPFFSAQALAQLQQHPRYDLVQNQQFVERLRTRLASFGNKANLACTLAVDHRNQPKIVVHAKVTPSQFEQRQPFNENTQGIDELHLIELRWNRPAGSKFVILPLICSDFVLRHETSQTPLLRLIAERCRPVNLICVLSVQSCHATAYPPWPREYQLATLDVAERRIHAYIDRAHTTVTNVGAYIAGETRTPAGYSFIGLQNGPRYEPYRQPLHWDGISWYFGKFRTAADDMAPGYCWVRRDGATWSKQLDLERQVCALLTHAPIDGVKGVLQHFELSVAREGEEAWQSGRILVVRNSKSIEAFNG